MQNARSKSLLTIAVEISNANPEMNAQEVVFFMEEAYDLSYNEEEELIEKMEERLASKSFQLSYEG